MQWKTLAISIITVLSFYSTSFAVLLNDILSDPVLAYDNQGTTFYDATTGMFTVHANPIAVNGIPGAPGVHSITPPPERVFIGLQVDALGALVSGFPGDDLVIEGTVDLGPLGTFVGSLLTGEITAFGFEDSGGSTDFFDFRFVITGGHLAPLFGGTGQRVGILMSSEISNFTGSFTVNFGGGAKGTLGALPAPGAPAIALEKATNGIDADDPDAGDAPQIAPDGAVTWSYVVTNIGNVPLLNVVVTDDQGIEVICPQTTLAVGESITCTAAGLAEDLATTNGPTVPGTCGTVSGQPLYENIAKVTAESATGEDVADQDPSHYCNPPLPAIDIEKFTNNQQADSANDGDVPQIAPGNTVIWTYLLANTGNVALARANISVRDDQFAHNGVTPIFIPGGGSDNGDGILAPGEVWEYMASLPAEDLVTSTSGVTIVPGCDPGSTGLTRPTYENIATAHESAFNLTDTDSSHYCNPPAPGINIEKFTNGNQADGPNDGDVPQIAPGDTVTWTYLVTNTGNISFVASDVVVTDNQGATPTFVPGGGTDDGDTILAPGEVWMYSAMLPAENLLSTTSGVTVVDGCDPGHTGLMRPTYENVGTVVVGTLMDFDPSHYCNPPVPGIDIEKLTNGVDADGQNAADIPQIAPGDTVTWTYLVTNTGNVPFFLADVVVTDNQGVTPTFVPSGGSHDGDTILEPGEVWEYTASRPAENLATSTSGVTIVPGCDPQMTGSTRPTYENVGLVKVGDLNDFDPSHYCNPAEPGIDIEKATNGEDADTPTGPVVAVGETVTMTYVVRNTGNVALSNVVVTDDHGTPGDDSDDGHPNFIGGDTDNDGLLDLDEVWTYEATRVATAGQFRCDGTVTGVSPSGETVTDTDPSHHLGALPAIDLEKAINGQDADTPTGPVVGVGDPITMTYVVRNTGNVPLSNVVVVDDHGTPGNPADDFSPTFVGGDTNNNGLLDLTEVWTYQAADVAVAGQFRCDSIVTAQSPTGQTVTDADPSHYYAAQPGIDLEKSVNGDDADTPTGPVVAVDDTITLTYVVRNTGNVPLSNVVVIDDHGTPDNTGDDFSPTFSGGDTNNNGLLDLTEVWTYEATDTAVVGQFRCDSTVSGQSPTGQTVTDADPGHYFAAQPGIDIRKQVEGPDTRTFPDGADVEFEIAVTNTGSVPLTDVVVSDPLAPVCDRVIGALAVNETVTYTCVVPGTPASGGTVTMTYKDTFSNAAFDNNDGDADWRAPWSENDPHGAGASNGNVTVSGGYLRLDDNPETGSMPSASRQVDLSGKTSATLSFTFKTTSGVDTEDAAAVEIAADGVHFTTLEVFTGIHGSTTGSRSFDISSFISDRTTVRFKIKHKYGGWDETFKVDKVTIVAAGQASGASSMTYKDTFSAISYHNSDGDSTWNGPWTEQDPRGGGAASGNVKVGSNYKLWLNDYPDSGTSPSAQRSANLAGKTSATLRFDFYTHPGVDPSDAVVVEVAEDGVNFTVLEEFTNISGSTEGQRTYDISAFISAQTTVRFRVSKNYGGTNETFKVDNLMIVAQGGSTPGGGFENEACASGQGSGSPVEDCDTSTVVIADSTPAIDIRKQAEGPDMQTLTVGSDIHFEIAVHNPGGVALSNVVVSDPAAPVCDRVIGTLDVDETFTYVCTVPAATFATMTFKDTFSAAAYDKNDGDSAWKGPWREEDAAGSGATRGNIKVDNGWLQLDDAPDTGRIPTLSRSANLSGKTRAFLSFDFKTTSGVDPSDVAAVKVSADGVHYTVLETFKGIDGTTSGSRSYDVSGFISDKTTIMFKIWDGYGGSYETFKVDNVMIVAFADTFNNEACASGEANGETVSDCDPSTVKVPVCVEQATGDARYAVSNSSHALYLPGIGTDFRFEPQAGPFTALADGTAQLTGTLRSVSHPNRGFVVDVTLSGRTSSPPSGSPKRDLKSAAYVENGGSVDTSTFVYYTNFSGTLTGIGDLEGAVLTISKTGPALQIGNGANNKNLNYGASAWLQWQVESQPDAGSALPTTGQGDLNLEFNADCFTGGSSDPQEPPDHNPPGHHMHMHARHSDKCLDVYGASTSQDADVIQWGCHSGANQEWSFQSMGDGTYEIIAAHSGKCLAVERGSSMPGANVIQRSCQGGVEQRWRLQPVGDGWYNIVAKHSGQCLDVSNNATTQGVSVTQWSCHGGANQKWRMVE